MTVIKLTSSKKGVQIIDDDGNVFQTSKFYVDQLLKEQLHGNFILLSRLPFKASADRFKKSPLYDAKGTGNSDPTNAATDALSLKSREENKQSIVYNTDVIL